MVRILPKCEQNVKWGISTWHTKIKNQHEIYDFTYVGIKMLFVVKTVSFYRNADYFLVTHAYR